MLENSSKTSLITAWISSNNTSTGWVGLEDALYVLMHEIKKGTKSKIKNQQTKKKKPNKKQTNKTVHPNKRSLTYQLNSIGWMLLNG